MLLIIIVSKRRTDLTKLTQRVIRLFGQKETIQPKET